MPTLLLLNGPPGVGKSTLAARWAATDPRRTCVDPDHLRAAMSEPDSDAARLAAREQAVERADAQLGAGTDVVIAQLCARPELPDRLREVALAHQAAYLEVLLLDSLAHLRQRLRVRSASPDPAHRLAAQDLDDDRLAGYRSALVARAGADPSIVVLECPQDQEDITLRAIEQVVATSG